MTIDEEIKLEADFSYGGNYKSLQKQCFIEGAKWADKTMIEKACNWIKERIIIPYEGKFDGNKPILTDYLTWCEDRNRESTIIVNEFIKAMEL